MVHAVDFWMECVNCFMLYIYARELTLLCAGAEADSVAVMELETLGAC